MRPLYDFGISQEDPLTELRLLDIQPNDHLLCVASGGEIPLSLLSLQPGLKITAVDISISQLILSRLKMQTALQLDFPLNAGFLGYAPADKKIRQRIYVDKIADHLSKNDQEFWKQNFNAIENGVINYGRFEGYIKKLRRLINLIIGKKNLEKLLTCTDTKQAVDFFDRHIAGRKAVRLLFKIAFHPAVYKNRGLSSKGLIHAQAKTGEIFFNKFRNFCTATPPDKNYFLQYFLLGKCISPEALPEYLQKENKLVLEKNKENIEWKNTSLQDELVQTPGTFNKIHLSNIGDWLNEKDFNSLIDLLCLQSTGNEKLCYRFLQKNHLTNKYICDDKFEIKPVCIEKTDRFPFYSVLMVQGHE